MASNQVASRRCETEIIYEVLSVCNNGGINKTAIMYRCNLSYDQLRRYLPPLVDRQLIYKDQAGHFHSTTDGQRILKMASVAVRTIRRLHTYLEPVA